MLAMSQSGSRLNLRTRSTAQVIPLVAGATLICIVAGYVASHSLRLSLFASGIALVPLFRKKTAMLSAITLVVSLGLIRRVLSPGRIDYDPFLLVPPILIGLSVILPNVTRQFDNVDRPQRYPIQDRVLILTLSTVGAFVLAQITAPWTGAAGLYSGIIQIMAYIIIFWTAQGYLPNTWPTLRGYMPWLGAAAAGYGIYQFYVLPSWDRNWMLATQLQSVGKPIPQLVRVFGASESPGPFSVVLSIALLVSMGEFIRCRSVAGRLIQLVLIGLMTYCLILTGVRTSLLVMALSLIIVALASRSLKVITVVTLACVALFLLVGRVIGNEAASGTNILTAKRFSVSGLSSDQSLNARKGLLDLVIPAFHHPFGQGRSTAGAVVGGYDNTFVDLLVAYGPIVAIAATALLIALLLRSLRWVYVTRARVEIALPTITIYLAISSIAGNLFTSTTGLLGAYLIGLMVRAELAQRADAEPSHEVHHDGIHRRSESECHLHECAIERYVNSNRSAR